MNVRQLRESNGLSLQQLAAGTGIPKDRIAKWEQGKGAPKVEDSRILDKYFRELVTQSATRRPETPQNGTKSHPHPTITRIGELIKAIQYKTNPSLSIEQIAERIGYSRGRLTTLVNQGDSQKVYDKLKEEFKDILNDMTTSTKLPAFEVKTPTEKDATIFKQADTINKHADTLKGQQETIGKLTDLVSKLIQK